MSRQGRESTKSNNFFFSNQLPLVSTGCKHVMRVQSTSQNSLRRQTDNGRSALDGNVTSVLSQVASGVVRTAGDRVPPLRCLKGRQATDSGAKVWLQIKRD